MNNRYIFLNGARYRREPASAQTTCADCQISGCSGPDYSDDWEPPVDCGVGACLCMLAINVVGAAFVASLIDSAFIVNPSDALTFSEQSADIVRGKASGLANAFYSAIPCGALVRVSGEIYRKTGRFVDMAAPVAVFVLCGFRHCVVEAFYSAPLAVVVAVAVGNGVGAMFVDLCIKGKTTLEPSSVRRTF